MERSIETARRRRLHDTDDQPRPRPVPVEHAAPTNGDTDLPRRKARPKRSTPDLRRYEGEYRADAI